jgi:hypothetical protein
MKTTKIIALLIGASSIAALTSTAGPSVTVQIGAPPPVVVVAPAPAPVIVSTVPDTYVWDGVEYVGVVGGAYFYLGVGNVWLPFDSVRVARFHDWERVHGDWRDHAIRNDRFRNDAHGHVVPMRAPAHDDHGHDNGAPDRGHDDHHNDHDHDH